MRNLHKWNQLLRACLPPVLIGFLPLVASAAPPVVLFSDLTWGPKTGWQGSTTQGAAVTIWGEDFGSTRGTSFVTVNGASLTADTDYAEWGAAGPARGLQRITFWLNSTCADGGGNITVTVNGVASNALPFTVATGKIYFVSVTDGNNNNNGLFSSAQGGTNGPFRDIYMFNPQDNPSGDGQYIVYVRGGTYTTLDVEGDGAFLVLGGPSGSSTQQKALIGYPGETAILDETNATRGGVWPKDYAPYTLDSYYTYAKLTFANGGDGIDNFGNNIRIIGNHMQNMLQPVWSGVVFSENSQNVWIEGNFFDHCGATTNGSYKHNIYSMSTSLSVNQPSQYHYIGWNEFANPESGTDNRGGVVFARTDGSVSSQFQTNHIYYFSNYFHGGNQDFIEIGDGPPQNNIVVYNNLFVGGPSVNSPISIEWTTSNAYLYQNTIYLAGAAGVSIVDTVGNAPGTHLDSKNNIFYALAGQLIFNVESGSTMTSDHDLFYSASGIPAVPSGTGLTLTNPIVADPLFANAAGNDFHLQAGSPAIDAGTSNVSSIVTQDFDGLARPQGAGYDIGAFEYASGGAPPVISVGVTPATANLSAGGTQQFTATVGGTSNTAVTWSMNPSVGTLSSSGLYTAPSSISSQQSVQVTATSAADATKTGVATINLQPPATVVSISVTPASVSLSAGGTQQFTATVGGTANMAVTWSMNPSVGTLSASGLYTAPNSIPTQQSVVVTATSAADSTKAAAARVTLVPPAAPAISVTVGPSGINLGQGQSQQFSASVTGTTNTAVTWSMNPAVGTLTTAGLYTAPGTITGQQPVQIIATSVADTTKSASVTVALTPPVAAPPPPTGPPTPAPGYSVSWTALSGTQLKVSWSAPAGHSPYDSLILTGYGAVEWWNTWAGQTGGAASGTFTVSMPTSPGIWQFRYISNAKDQVMAVSAVLPVNVSQFSVTATPTTSRPTGTFTVSWTAPAGRPQTWADTIGLYKAGATNDAPVWQQYTMGATSGTLSVHAPAPGIYEFRYVLDYVAVAHSAAVNVVKPSKQLTTRQRTR